MNGKGCAGSIAWGVSSGKICSRKCWSSQASASSSRLLEADHADADLRERLLELGEHRQLTADQPVGFLIDRLEAAAPSSVRRPTVPRCRVPGAPSGRRPGP